MLGIEGVEDRVKIEALRSMGRTIAHDFNQPLAILQAEIQLAAQLGLMPRQEDWATMQEAVSLMVEKIRQYQQISYYSEINDNAGFTILDLSKK